MILMKINTSSGGTEYYSENRFNECSAEIVQSATDIEILRSPVIDFLETLAKYSSENWKGNFTPEEIQDSVCDMYAELVAVMQQGRWSYIIAAMFDNLAEDVENGSTKAKYFRDRLQSYCTVEFMLKYKRNYWQQKLQYHCTEIEKISEKLEQLREI